MVKFVHVSEKMESKTYKIDASGKILGRLAAQIAVLLRGKNKANFLRHIENQDIIEVVNVEKILFSGKKIKQKIYYHHSSYPGGLKEQTLEKKLKNDPASVLRQAVYGMLPKNRMRAKLIKNLKIL